jgi:hypothetical protein
LQSQGMQQEPRWCTAQDEVRGLAGLGAVVELLVD